MRTPRQHRRTKNVPSQAPSRATPFFPSLQADISQHPPLQRPHQPGTSGAPEVYVISTFDARPIAAVDFTTQSGSNENDTGYDPYSGDPLDPAAGPFTTSSIFYTVQPGYTAILRDWQLLIVPERGENNPVGEPPSDVYPIFTANGSGNFRCVISFYVDGTAQNGINSIVSWAGAFGDIFGDAYVVATEGQTIEMRVTGNEDGSRWHQAIMSMHGNLLLSKGMQADYEPGTDAVIPVAEQAATVINERA